MKKVRITSKERKVKVHEAWSDDSGVYKTLCGQTFNFPYWNTTEEKVNCEVCEAKIVTISSLKKRFEQVTPGKIRKSVLVNFEMTKVVTAEVDEEKDSEMQFAEICRIARDCIESRYPGADIMAMDENE